MPVSQKTADFVSLTNIGLATSSALLPNTVDVMHGNKLPDEIFEVSLIISFGFDASGSNKNFNDADVGKAGN